MGSKENHLGITLRVTNIEVENHLFVAETGHPRNHAIHFCEFFRECSLWVRLS